MIKKLRSLIPLIAFFLLFTIPAATFAQCAGNDVLNYEICDIPNPSSQAIDLFSLLGSGAVPGGTWSDDDLSRGFDETTGVLNAQIVPASGVYHYTYTVAGGCADTSATVTVTIGGYAGETNFRGTPCSDNHSYNLFEVFNNSLGTVSPKSNGTWFNNKTNTPVPGNVVDAEVLGLGDTRFTYTVAAIGSCLESVSTGIVTVVKAAEAGTPSKLLLCDNADFSLYTNVDLNNQLSGEDAGGTWVDNNGTGQITFLKDHNVDVQNIYNTRGIGEYTFTYTVLPLNPACDKKTSTVTIKIEPLLDFTGAVLVVSSDICESQISTASYSVRVTKGPAPIPNGSYNVTYNVSGPAGETKTEVFTFSNGVMNFPLDSKYFQQKGNFIVQITNITAVGSEGACINIINNLLDDVNVYPTPVLTGAKLTIDPVCQNKSALVQITDASFLADGTYDIVYNLSGANTASAQTVRITVAGGVSSFTIPSSLIVNAGNTTVTITKITNVVSICNNTTNVSGVMVVRPLPNPANLKILVNDYCFNTPVNALLSGLGALTNIQITYSLSGSNTTTQTIALTVTGGNANFTIPVNLLTNTGATAIVINNLVNTDTTCDVILSNVSDGFSIIAIPAAPTAVSQQKFCKTNLAKVADLNPSGGQYQWFDSAAATTPLAVSTILVSGNYYVKEVTPTNSCLSTSTMVTVTINDLPAPVLNQDGQNFCGIDNPKVSDLSANTNAQASIAWYDAAVNGNVISGTDFLQDKKTYYGFDYSTVTGCFSENHIAVTVSLTDCTTTAYDFFIPDGFSPNNDTVNDTFRIPEIEFLFPDYSLEIYNRYGNLMFRGNKDKPEWDGKNHESAGLNDSIVPNGVYFYIVNFNKDNKSPQQGRLYLNR